MVSGVDLISHNQPLQNHWLRRIAAYVIDVVLIFVVYVLLSLFALVGLVGGGWAVAGIIGVGAVIIGVLSLLYWLFMDWIAGGTLGKKVVGLRVTTMDGQRVNPVQSVIRNVSKIFWALLLIDWILGLATEGDPRQKFTDRLAGVTVTRTDSLAYQEEQFRQMGRAPGWIPPTHAQAPQTGGPGPVYSPSTATVNPPPGAPPQGSPVPATAEAPSPSQPQVWPPPQPSGGAWPQHRWDQEGRLQPENKFCPQCGGQLVPRGDGRQTCIRCGAVY